MKTLKTEMRGIDMQFYKIEGLIQGEEPENGQESKRERRHELAGRISIQTNSFNRK